MQIEKTREAYRPTKDPAEQLGRMGNANSQALEIALEALVPTPQNPLR
jgi:hypothetical protein